MPAILAFATGPPVLHKETHLSRYPSFVSDVTGISQIDDMCHLSGNFSGIKPKCNKYTSPRYPFVFRSKYVTVLHFGNSLFQIELTDRHSALILGPSQAVCVRNARPVPASLNFCFLIVSGTGLDFSLCLPCVSILILTVSVLIYSLPIHFIL
jgi:hypothetical protein